MIWHPLMSVYTGQTQCARYN